MAPMAWQRLEKMFEKPQSWWNLMGSRFGLFRSAVSMGFTALKNTVREEGRLPPPLVEDIRPPR